MIKTTKYFRQRWLGWRAVRLNINEGRSFMGQTIRRWSRNVNATADAGTAAITSFNCEFLFLASGTGQWHI
jgi:hypothetical protein